MTINWHAQIDALKNPQALTTKVYAKNPTATMAPHRFQFVVRIFRLSQFIQRKHYAVQLAWQF